MPSDCAQEVCDRLVKLGIKGIWCFTPTPFRSRRNNGSIREHGALLSPYLNKKNLTVITRLVYAKILHDTNFLQNYLTNKNYIV